MIVSVLSEKTRAISGKVFCLGTQGRVMDRPGFELTTLSASHIIVYQNEWPIGVLTRRQVIV